jgi:nucleoside-triphosphatase THEP1
MIYFFTGPVRSGKTTALIQWAGNRKHVYGVFTPDAGEKRVFMNADSKEIFSMEAAGNEETIAIGRFSFSKKNFVKASLIISDAIEKEGWLVIDEIGPLELKGEGFAAVLKEILAQRKDKIILVVREGLVEKVISYFEIQPGETKILDTETINQLI